MQHSDAQSVGRHFQFWKWTSCHSKWQKIALFSGRLKQVYRPRSPTFVGHLSLFLAETPASVWENVILCWQKVMLKVNLASQNLFLSQFHDLSSMRVDSKYRTRMWSQFLSPKPPSGGQYDNFEKYFWQIFVPICSLAWDIKRMCFANLEMRHSFMDLLKMVWCLVLFDMILPCNMICDIDFSFKMTQDTKKMHDVLPDVSCFR